MRVTTVFTLLTALVSLSSVSARAFGSNTTPAHSQFLRLHRRAGCDTGKYKNSNGQCVSCTAGYYCQNDVRTPCPIGTYQPSTGRTTCLPCSAGTFNDETGKTSCESCPKGTYNPNSSSTSQTACIRCPAGSFNDKTGQSSCEECDAGRYNPNTGSDKESACRVCPAGSFQSQKGAASCCTCCSGFYQNETGKTSCKTCSYGWTSTPGSDSSNDCRNSSSPPRSTTCSTNSPDTCPATTPGPSPSNVPRSLKREQQAIRQCENNGPGFKRCAALNGGYECLDTLNDFESCGGCVNFTYQGEHREGTGLDCGAIPNVSTVSCQAGKCIIGNCRKGYQVSDDKSSCIESPRKRSFL